ncbi:PREDICTED: rhodanese-like domain-containing protein 4A, chloroplastic [Tarenaya hassleriana]|uniref:rhodanese-like domain-containing protein 4A, chloroplastic n=1 Tax=Tarenaya hassleriana TaxID=28532 RepID=UPI00053C9DE7|nr:PREDICTED: rhodanese-like domain-containing protein 4A, chloroplastic [Tarenaya hassleriana]
MTSLPLNLCKFLPKPKSQVPGFDQIHFSSLEIKSKSRNFSTSLQLLAKTHLSVVVSELVIASPCLASESAMSVSEEVSGKIDLESILVSIDDFINRYPFFVAGCTFVWLVVVPVAKYYLSKFKPISAMNAFRKLKKLPSSQLLDIRDEKALASLSSPNLKLLGKSTVQVPYSEEDELGFLEKVKRSFSDPENTVVCVLDNFDGNSSKVAELLVENGFQEAYYIKGGVRGKDGWLAIQEELLPPLVHMYRRKKVKPSTNSLSQRSSTENGSSGSGSENAMATQMAGDEQTTGDGTESARSAKTDSRPFSP